MNFRFPPPPNCGHMVAKLDKVSKSYGPLNVFKGFDFEINSGEKLAIVGPNGAGKSTFCRIITGQEAPDDGNHNFGLKVATSFFSQNHADELDPTRPCSKPCEVAAPANPRRMPEPVRLLPVPRRRCLQEGRRPLRRRTFPRRAGLHAARPANFLILDEPTNHLDMQSQEVLQRALADYAGTVMIVSHNRAFLDPLVPKTLEFRPGEQPLLFEGNITYYLEKTAEEKRRKSHPQAAAAATAAAGERLVPPVHPRREPQGPKRIEAEQRELRTQVLKPLEDELVALETKIADLETAQATLTQQLSSEAASNDPAKLREVTNAVDKIAKSLEASYFRWGALSDEIERCAPSSGSKREEQCVPAVSAREESGWNVAPATFLNRPSPRTLLRLPSEVWLHRRSLYAQQLANELEMKWIPESF